MKIKRKGSSRLNRSVHGNIILLVFVSIFAVLMLLPLIYSVSSSLKPLNELWYFPPRFFVENPTWKNYADLFSLLNTSWVPFTRYLSTTLLVSVVGTGGHVVLSSMCAYTFSKHRFIGSRVSFRLIVLSLMFSSSVTAVPSYLIIAKLHLVDTLWALILPAFSSSLGLYLMKQFMDSMVPYSLLESARLDGAGEFRILFQIVMPIVKPAWLTLIVFSFQNLWNASGGIYIQTESWKTLNYAIGQIITGGIARAGTGAASIVVMMLLPILVFVVTQSNVIETMATSGMKD